MTASTDIVPFATASGANVLDQADYISAGFVQTGFSAGIAQSAQVNKALRQATFVASTLATYIIDETGVNFPDDGNLTGAVLNLTNAIKAAVAGQNGHFYTFAGNPNTNVAGIAGVAGASPPDLCEDTTTGHLWVCTTSGNAASAVWTLGASAGVTSVATGAGLTGGPITGTGTISVLTASTSVLGSVKVDGSSITINGSGVISSANAGGSINPQGNVTVVGDFAAWSNTSGTQLKDVAPANAAQVRAMTDNASPLTSLSQASAAAFQTLTDVATTSWNLNGGFNARWVLGGNRTLAITGTPNDGIPYSLLVIQPASGGPCTVTWPASFKWGQIGAPTLSTGASVIDRVSLQYDAASSSYMASFYQGA